MRPLGGAWRHRKGRIEEAFYLTGMDKKQYTAAIDE
jgi:hypothetical protein